LGGLHRRCAAKLAAKTKALYGLAAPSTGEGCGVCRFTIMPFRGFSFKNEAIMGKKT
jgi:hypothetical protein